MKEKKDSVTIIDELWQIVEELEARDISANSIYENLHDKNFNVYIEHRDIKEDVHKGDKKL